MAAVREEVLTGEQVRRFLDISDEELYWLKVWGSTDAKRSPSTAERFAALIHEAVGLDGGDSIIDFGCGDGRLGFDLWNAGYNVTLVDIAENCLDPIVEAKMPHPALQFVAHDITKLRNFKAHVGICADVLHVLDESKLSTALQLLVESCNNLVIIVKTAEDEHSKIVKPYRWWLQKMVDFDCTIHRSAFSNDHAIFYVSGRAEFFLQRFAPNTDNEQLAKNIRTNAASGKRCRQVMVYEPQDVDAMLLAGGPSLNLYEDEIIKKRAQGAKLLTVNGAYNWCMERGLKPSATFVLDARNFNKRFVRPIVDDCQYIIGSAVDPELFDGLPHDRTWFWNVNTDDELRPVLEEVFGEPYKDWLPIVGGSTVMLRALYTCKLMGLGLKRPLDVYGFDSCIADDGGDHHAYPQPENDPDDTKTNASSIVSVKFNGERKFDCQLWMLAQAKEYLLLRKNVLSDLNLNIKGNGLINYLHTAGINDIDEG